VIKKRSRLVVSHEEPVVNVPKVPTFEEILLTRLNRRQVLRGSIATAAVGVFGVGLVGCGGGDDDDDDDNFVVQNESLLGFKSVPTSTADTVLVPEGYTVRVLIPWGTPITGSYPAYRGDGSNTAEEQAQQIGQNHDGMHYFPINGSSEDGVLALNHEYINADQLHPNGPEISDDNVRPTEQVAKEMTAHGIAIVRIQKQADGTWTHIPDMLNRRITLFTPMDISGPAAGSDLLKTAYSPTGTATRGTVNNCSHGFTPWNTYLTCEENFQGYFINTGEVPAEQDRYGITDSGFGYLWSFAESDDPVYKRFDANPTADSATEDYRNEVNNFGWIVEIDPFDPDSTPVKRTAMGRFRHEGVVFAPIQEGRPLVAYSGDDARFEYIYKFVTARPYQAGTTNGDILDEGTLYVARFNDDGSGEWIALVQGQNGLTAEAGFPDQATVLVHARLAADLVGATPMDRPEWGAVNPNNGDVYFNLTNNSRREEADAANPRAPNRYGHIVRWAEAGGDHTATSFTWDLFLLSGTTEESSFNGQPLTDEQIHNSPDGLWFDPDGRLWIETDGSDDEPFGNNMMLAADPEAMDLKRFLVGPVGCEVTGVHATPDQRTLFANIQHPEGHWPDGGTARPRSATMVITKDDGGVIGT